MTAKNGSRWPQGTPLVAYGQWRLSTTPEWSLLVEGESDCWTAWLHAFPAIGLPGANTVNATLTEELLARVRRLFVVEEPDRGGEAFIKGVARVVERAGWTGTVQVVRFDGAKDLNDLFQKSKEQFPVVLQAALASAPLLEKLPVSVTGGDQWPEPTPIESPAVRRPEFIADRLLPVSLRPYLVEVAQLIGAPIECGAVAAMVGLGATVGRRMTIRPRRLADWVVVPNLWGAVVGPPGMLKTPAMRAALEPVMQLDSELRRQQEQVGAAHQFNQLVAKERREELARKVRDEIKGGRDPEQLRSQTRVSPFRQRI